MENWNGNGIETTAIATAMNVHSACSTNRCNNLKKMWKSHETLFIFIYPRVTMGSPVLSIQTYLLAFPFSPGKVPNDGHIPNGLISIVLLFRSIRCDLGRAKSFRMTKKNRSSHRNNSFDKRDTKSVCSDGNRIILYWNSTSHFLRCMVLIRLGRKALELLTTNEWDSSELNLKWMWGDLKLLFLVWLLYSIIQFTNNVSISKPKTYANI